MVNGPPCPTCGTPLRWYPAPHDAWGCDRCRVMHPAQPPQQQQRPSQPAPHTPPPHAPPPHAPPQHPPQQQHQGHYNPTPHHQTPPPHGHAMPPPAGGKSKTGLYIGLGVGALAVAGGIVAIVMLTGKGDGPSGGGSSREDVVKKTVAALAKGDADALMKLTGVENRDRFIKCENKQDPEDRKKNIAKLRERYQEAADAVKGAKVEVVAIEKDDDPEVTKKGTRFEEGEGECETTMEVTEHRFEIKIKVTPKDGKAGEQETRMSVMTIGGGWFLDKPPEIKVPGSCDKAVNTAMDKTEADTIKTAGGKVSETAMKAALKDMRAVAIKRCTEDSWDDDVLECLNKESTTTAKMDACFKRLSTTQNEKFEAEIGEVVKKHQALNGTGGDTVTPDPPRPTQKQLGPACTEYRELIKTIDCAIIDDSSRKMLIDQLDKTISEYDGEALEAGCSAGLTVLRDSCKKG